MTDYGHDLVFGSFLTPRADQPEQVIALGQLSEQVGLDLVTVQDHPYQPTFLDTWTLLSYLAAATLRIRLSANVLNLPLRGPTIIARSAASLDRLSNGRVELAIGAGGFWDAIEANGGNRLTAGQAVDALDEAIQVIRELWNVEQRGGVRVDGEHYRVVGAKRGPAPVHRMEIWVGALKPRMLRLIGRSADGWLPSLSYLPDGPASLPELNATIDAAAVDAGRDPSAVRRLLNISGQFAGVGSGFLAGPAAQWAEELAAVTLEHGVSTFILSGDDPADLQTFGEEVAPTVREIVAAERARQSSPPPAGSQPGPAPARDSIDVRDAAGVPPTPTPPPLARFTTQEVWDESTRPQAPPAPADHVYTEHARAAGQHLVDVHDHLRAELRQLRDLLQQVEEGVLTAAQARGAVNEMTLRRNDWTLGAYCAQYCSLLTQHHALEDQAIFPHLRGADPALAPVIDRLAQEHLVIHDVVMGIDRALVQHMNEPGDFDPLREALDVLTDALLSHLSYEEQQLVEPIARFGFYRGQL
jgi:alkanesulfonate monooxygenase SsuD/methylene tetrahydromethanopterin reductase-like flavin-dependent oxidoreductase (luciferase family)